MNADLYLGDNEVIMQRLLFERGAFISAAYADPFYENEDFGWINLCYFLLKENGICYLQTDQHTVYEMKLYCDLLFGEKNFINDLIYINEWGGTSKHFFSKKHDNILMYSKGKNYKFYPERIQIPKKTAHTVFDKKGTGLKTPCDVFYDHLSFSTISNERVKDKNGKNITWQKPFWLMERLLLPVTDEEDYILEPFGGTFPACKWAIQNNRNAIGIELDPFIFELGKNF